MKKLLAIVGPTGSGKSQLGLILANRLDGEIISADSRQIYRFLDIGTSKPSRSDQEKIPHHFIDSLDPREEYSAGAYGREARGTIIEIAGRNKQPILVGGSGLYVKAVIDGFFDGPGKDVELRNQLETRLKEGGSSALLANLKKVDPESAATMDASKPRRIIRALEVFYITGKPLSEFHKEQSSAAPFETVEFGIQWERSRLYERIDQRVEAMLEQGLVDEVRRLKSDGYDRKLNALNSVGYKEVFDYFDGDIDYEEMIESMKRNTRRFAKRQLTWFRADKRIKWITIDDSTPLERVADRVAQAFLAG